MCARRKRGRSLQALFIPPFLQSSVTNRFRSHSETGQTQPVTISSPTTPTTTTTSTITTPTSQDSPQLDPFSQALYSFTSTENVVSLDSPYTDLLDADPFADLSTPPCSPTNQDNSLQQNQSVHGAIPTPTTPRSPLSPVELRSHPLHTTGIKYTSATTPSSPVSGAFHLSSPARPAYTKPVFKSTPSLPSLRALSQGQYIPTYKVSQSSDRLSVLLPTSHSSSSSGQIRKGRVGATLPVEPWNQIEATDPVLEESWLSSLDVPRPSERPPPHDHVRATDNVVIYSGGFNDSSEDLLSSPNALVQPETDFGIPPSLSRHPSDPSFLSVWDDGLSSLSSFTAESESDFQTSISPTWSSFSRRSSGEGNTSSIFDVPSPPYSLASAIDVLNSGTDLSRSDSGSSISLSDEDLALPSLPDGCQISTSLPPSADFHPGTSVETIRPSPSQLIWLGLSKRSSSQGSSRQRSRSSSQSSSIASPPGTRPVTPNPSECSYLSMEEPDEEDNEGVPLYDRDIERGDDQISVDDDSEAEMVYDRDSPLMGSPRGDGIRGDLSSANSEQPEDGEGSSSGYYGSGRYTGTSTNGHGYGGLGSRSSGTHRSNGGASGSGGGRDGDGRRPSQPSVPLRGIDEDDDTDSADENDEDEPSTNPRRPVAPARKQSSDEDDLPLARSIPSALKAQRTIRKKVREENAQRRQERAMRMQAKIQNVSSVPRSPEPATTAFQHDQTSPPQFPSRTVGRARTQTSPLSQTTRRSPFAVDDLTKKLMDVQTSMTGPNDQELHRSGTRSSRQRTQEPGPSSKSRPSQELSRPPPPAPLYPIHETFQKPTLRPMRSFHRPAKTSQPETHAPPPTSDSGGAAITHSRSVRRPRTGDPTDNQPTTPTLSNFSLQRSKSTKSQNQARPLDEDYGSTGRPSMSRPSAEVSVDSHWSEKAAALPPVPPVPTYDMLMRQKSGETWQQKVFLGDMQRSTVVEVGTTTSAQDVIDAIESRGEMGPYDPGNNGGKGWMLFELAQDFGMGTLLPRDVSVPQLNANIHRATHSVLRGPFRHQSLLE